MHPAISLVPTARVVLLKGHFKHQNLSPTLNLVSLAGTPLKYPSSQGSHTIDTLFSSIPSVQSAIKRNYLQLFYCFHFVLFCFFRFLLPRIKQHLFIMYIAPKIHILSIITNNHNFKQQSKAGRLMFLLSDNHLCGGRFSRIPLCLSYKRFHKDANSNIIRKELNFA